MRYWRVFEEYTLQFRSRGTILDLLRSTIPIPEMMDRATYNLIYFAVWSQFMFQRPQFEGTRHWQML